MRLWKLWFDAVASLRPACTRSRTFCWMVVALMGMSVRADLAGVTSFVRALGLDPAKYQCLLDFFHSSGLLLDRLTSLWTRWCRTSLPCMRVGDYVVCLADGLKVAKEGRKMPAVKRLHQTSENNSKPPFIFGHSFQVVSLLVQGRGGHVAAVPLAARIQEGLVWSNHDRRTLLDKLVDLFLSLTDDLEAPVLLVADAYYASRKVILPLLERGHHLITRARSNTVAYRVAPQPHRRGRGRPRLYGARVRLRDLLCQDRGFTSARSPISGEKNVPIEYRCVNLLWRPVGRLVRFVLVRHPKRGHIILMSTDVTIDPLDVIALYAHRYKIELGFRQALHVVGSYAYHFWMITMTPIRRTSGNQSLHRKSEIYRQAVRRKMAAYHRYVALACIAQGLLQSLAILSSDTVWRLFPGWLRTMDPSRPPSELVVAGALRPCLLEFLAASTATTTLGKFLRDHVFARPGPLHQVLAA